TTIFSDYNFSSTIVSHSTIFSLYSDIDVLCLNCDMQLWKLSKLSDEELGIMTGLTGAVNKLAEASYSVSVNIITPHVWSKVGSFPSVYIVSFACIQVVSIYVSPIKLFLLMHLFNQQYSTGRYNKYKQNSGDARVFFPIVLNPPLSIVIPFPLFEYHIYCYNFSFVCHCTSMKMKN
ncbi:hypothetical protein ACJX0J_020313, partial [Zea mays]